MNMNPSALFQILDLPKYKNEEEQRVALVIHGITMSIGVAVIIGLVGVIFIFQEKFISSLALGVLFITGLITNVLSKRGRVRAASIILLSLLWTITLGLVSISGGMRSLDIVFFITGTVVAGLLLGQRGTYFYGGLSVLAGIAFLVMDSAGIILPDLFPFPASTGLVLLLINFAVLIPALNTTLNTLHHTIQQSEQRLDNQKKIEEELRFSEEKFAKAFHASPMAIMIQRTADRRYIDINEGFSRITGYSREEALNLTPIELNLYPDEEIAQQLREKFLAQGYVRDFEAPFRRKDGTFGHVLIWGEFIKINNEDMTIAGTIDITERKQFEILQAEQAQEIKTLYDALSEITAIRENINHMAQKITDVIVDKFQATKCSLWLLTDDKTNLTRVAYSGKDIIESIDDIPVNSRGLMTHSLNSNKSIYEPDVNANPSFMMVDKTTRSEFVVPLQAHGDVIGVINMESPDLDGFNDRTRRLVEAFAQNAALAIQNAQLIDSLETSVANLKETQARINFFLEHTAEGIYRFDYDPPIPTNLSFKDQYRLGYMHGTIGECNDAFAKMYGYASKEDVLGKSVREFYGDEGYDANLDANLDFYYQGYKLDNLETEELNNQGETVYFLSNVVGIIRGDLFVSTWGTQRDITSLKKTLAEKEKLNQELGKSLAELKVSQERLNFFLEHTAEGIYRMDYIPPIPIDLPYEEQYRLSRERGRIGECNAAIAKMYGYSSREEMLATPYHVTEEGYDASLEANFKLYSNGYKSFDAETEEYLPSGEKAYFLNNTVGIVEEGHLMALWGTQQDITPLKNVLAELEERNAELERFIYTLSHELKTPIVTMRGFLDFLKKDFSSGNKERILGDFNRITNAADKMYLMISELIELFRVGRLVNPPEDVPFEEIALAGLNNVEASFEELNAQIHIQPNMPTVHVDLTRMIEVVQNLIENAIKNMEDQSDPQVNIGVREDGDEQIFFVSDNGIGIEPDFQERVFNIFEKLNPQSDGTGIGLAIVKRIIEIHKGRIWVESEGNGKGSTFCFTLPISEL